MRFLLSALVAMTIDGKTKLRTELFDPLVNDEEKLLTIPTWVRVG